MTRHLTEITVVGEDDTGLIAEVTSLLFERSINIEDLDQAVREGLFRMTMHVETEGMVCTEEKLREDLNELGDDLGVDVQVRFPPNARPSRWPSSSRRRATALEALFEAWGQRRPGGRHRRRHRQPLRPPATRREVRRPLPRHRRREGDP